MSDRELIVALVPDTGTQHIIGSMNRSLKDAWHHQDPIDLAGALGERNSVAHMTLFHMYMGAGNIPAATNRMNLIAGKLGKGFRLEVAMEAIELWWNHWVFWMPAEIIPRSPEWANLRGLVMFGDDEVEAMPKLRSRDHELPTDIELTAMMYGDHSCFGYAFSHMPHITIAYVRDEASFEAFPTHSMRRTCWFTKLVLAERGPRGTITKVLHEVPLGGSR